MDDEYRRLRADPDLGRYAARRPDTDAEPGPEDEADELHRHNLIGRPGNYCTHGGGGGRRHEHPELGYGPAYDVPEDD